jgi:hypothetical protein
MASAAIATVSQATACTLKPSFPQTYREDGNGGSGLRLASPER